MNKTDAQTVAVSIGIVMLAAKLAGGILVVTVARICTRGDREQEPSPTVPSQAPSMRELSPPSGGD